MIILIRYVRTDPLNVYTSTPSGRSGPYLDEVVGAEAEELQQLKVAACRQDVLDHSGVQQNLTRGHRRMETHLVSQQLRLSILFVSCFLFQADAT